MQRNVAAALFVSIFATVVGLDWWTKILALEHLQYTVVPVIGDFATFRLAFNTGVAFSALDGVPSWLLGAGAFVLVIVVVYSLRKLLLTKLGNVSLALVAAGGLSNAVDRLADGKVTDMISVWIWPVFNVADSAITVGVLLLFFTPREKKEEAPAPAAGGTGT